MASAKDRENYPLAVPPMRDIGCLPGVPDCGGAKIIRWSIGTKCLVQFFHRDPKGSGYLSDCVSARISFEPEYEAEGGAIEASPFDELLQADVGVQFPQDIGSGRTRIQSRDWFICHGTPSI